MSLARRRSRPSHASREATHTVRAGESLSAIAARHLGDGTRWREIHELNRKAIPDPDRIHPGMVLRLPGGGGQPGKEAASGAPGRTVTVGPGDSLAAIAGRTLGDMDRWPEIFQANRDQIRNPSVVHPGMVLRIPGPHGENMPAPTPDPGPAPDVSKAEDGTRYDVYFVGPGDSLARIARRHTGDAKRWRELWEINREALPNPTLIHVGTPLRLPRGWDPLPPALEKEERAAPAPSGGDEETDAEAFRAEVYRSLARYEGGDPTAVHYDSGRVNIGKGSWTGGHIVRLLEIYEQKAAENGAIDRLYRYFGGRRAFEAVRERFRRYGARGWLSPAEENAFRQAGRDPLFQEAQDAKGGEDVLRYLDNIATFSPPYPWLDAAGTISEMGAMVLCHAGHQSGSPRRAYDAVRAGRTAEQLRRAYGSEGNFLSAVADLIVSWVQPQYRRGVRNRYNWLFATYGYTRRYRL